jgi:7-cyano-7-deazaguanine reductase
MAKRLTTSKDLSALTLLGKDALPQRTLETFPNHHADRDYTVSFTTDEFTTLGPVNRQPDFAVLTIEYVPGKKLLESKSLKLYLQTYRNVETFYEHVVNQILDDMVVALKPKFCKVSADYAVRGGIAMSVHTSYQRRR